MNYVSTENMVNDIRSSIEMFSDEGFDLIVGIPRSGMIPAYSLALHLNIDVTDFGSFINNIPLQRGVSRENSGTLALPHEAKKILLVDDSYATGRSLDINLQQIPESLKSRVKTFAVYTVNKKSPNLDFYIKVIHPPRVFEWNILNHKILENSCLDIDGVLCIDPTNDENDDGEKYTYFLENAKPKFIPKVKVKYLVTNRLEKYRKHTEYWLAKHHVRYEHLIMLKLATKEERQALAIHSSHKSSFYKTSGCILFVESDKRQAYDIMSKTGMDVYCVEDNKMYTPKMSQQLQNNPVKGGLAIIKWLPKKIFYRLPASYQRKLLNILKIG